MIDGKTDGFHACLEDLIMPLLISAFRNHHWAAAQDVLERATFPRKVGMLLFPLSPSRVT